MIVSNGTAVPLGDRFGLESQAIASFVVLPELSSYAKFI